MITGIMLTLNEKFFIRAAIENLSHLVDEILVMDGESTDGTLEYLKDQEGDGFRVIVNPQPVKAHYHPSWNEPVRWNTLIKEASNDWIVIMGADECYDDNTFFTKWVQKDDVIGIRMPRYNLASLSTYVGGTWYPDYQPRLFKRDAFGGIRWNTEDKLHGLPRTRMGKGGYPKYYTESSAHIIHYHDAIGPKVRDLGDKEIRDLPKDFQHPYAARKYLINNPETDLPKYDQSYVSPDPGNPFAHKKKVFGDKQ